MKYPGHGNRRAEVDAGLDALIQEARPGRRLSQTEIAHRCGCTQATIYQIEKRALRKIRQRFGSVLRELVA